jgi:hypothetical protein
MVIKVLVKAVFTIKFFMFLAALEACLAFYSFTTYIKVEDTTFYENLAFFLNTSIIIVNFPMA